jgi:hypothetical protein
MEIKDKTTRGKWYVINIKARERQQPEHYVQLFEGLKNVDPLITINANKSASLQHINFAARNEQSLPRWIEIVLMTYTILDEDSFYNKRKKEDVMMESWNPDWVANKNEVQLIFVPEIHILAVKKTPKVSLNTVLKYLTLAVECIEPDTFEVTSIKDKGVISRIQNAYAITKIEAKISFSNPAHTRGFQGLFDEKFKEMNPSSFELKAENKNGLSYTSNDDGLLNTIVNLSEQNGFVKARIKDQEDSQYEIIDTNHHPAEYLIKCRGRELLSYMYKFLIGKYGEK